MAQVILAVHGMDWVTGQVIECDGGLALRSPIDSYGEAMRARASRPPETRPDSERRRVPDVLPAVTTGFSE